MKRFTFIILWIAWGNIYAQNPQIPNHSFENWMTAQLKSLHEYFDSNDEDLNDNNIQQMTDAYSGHYAVKLESSLDADNEVQVGYFINFDPDHFVGGSPYTEHVDSICGYYKAHVVDQDSALLVTIFKNNGNMIGGGVYKFGADKNTNNWTRFCYPTHMPTGIIPDTLMLGAASSNAIEEVNMEPGSWIQLDSLFFKAGNQLTTLPPNHSFELWDSREINSPDSFETSLQWDITTNPLSIEKVSDATDGNYAIKLNTVINQEQDTIIGVLSNGHIGSWPFDGGMAVTTIPTGVSWDYKVNIAGFARFEPRVAVIFKNNGQEVDEFGQSYNQSQNSYQHVDLPINLNSPVDTLLFVAFSGGYPGNSLWLDNVMLHYPSGTTDNLNIQRSMAFPIPANNQLNFKIKAIKPEDIKIQIMDLKGRIVTKRTFNLHSGENQLQIKLNDLSKGVYFYNIKTKDQNFTQQFIKK